MQRSRCNSHNATVTIQRSQCKGHNAILTMRRSRCDGHAMPGWWGLFMPLFGAVVMVILGVFWSWYNGHFRESFRDVVTVIFKLSGGFFATVIFKLLGRPFLSCLQRSFSSFRVPFLGLLWRSFSCRRFVFLELLWLSFSCCCDGHFHAVGLSFWGCYDGKSSFCWSCYDGYFHAVGLSFWSCCDGPFQTVVTAIFGAIVTVIFMPSGRLFGAVVTVSRVVVLELLWPSFWKLLWSSFSCRRVVFLNYYDDHFHAVG